MKAKKARFVQPSTPRIVLGFAAAVATPMVLLAAATALESGNLLNGVGFAAIVTFYGIILAVFVGVSTLWVLQDKVPPTLRGSIFAGCFVACPPGILFSVWDWRLGGGLLMLSLPLGAVGGVAFWWVTFRGLKPL